MVMKVSNDDIKNIFIKLINESISREDADRWAYKIIEADDLDDLELHPSNKKHIMWEAIDYLYGIDMKLSPDEYMHSIDQIKEVYESEWKDKLS